MQGNPGYSEAIGLCWWRDGKLTVKPSHALKLFRETNPVVASTTASPKKIQEIVGLWSWALLLRRQLFSVLFHTYNFCRQPQPERKRRISDAIIRELSILLDVFPMVYADLSLPLSKVIYDSDASPSGAGVVYADIDDRELWNFKSTISETRCRHGWSTLLCQYSEERDSEFISSEEKSASRQLKVSVVFEKVIKRLNTKTAISTQWKFPNHINVLETEAFLLAVRHMVSIPKLRGSRIISLLDNTAALGAMTKGCSSSWAIKKVYRKSSSQR